MKKMIAGWLLAITIIAHSSVNADGLLFQLPKDGSWAEFAIDGVATKPDDAEVTLVGKIRLSSVGKVQIDGKPCRWIELRTEAKRNDEKYTDIVKMLIPEKNLVRGQDPLKHMLRGWSQDSHTPGGPRARDLNAAGLEYLRKNSTFLLVHGRYDNTPQKLDKTMVESKLGKLECEGVKAMETRGGLKCTYETRLHDKAPFGVVTHECIVDFMEKGSLTVKLKLSDFGTDAKSSLPDSN